MNNDNIRILLCSDAHHFSTLDLYKGYFQAFNQLGVDFIVAELHELVDESKVMHLSYDSAFGLILAKAVNVENEITHVLFISGLLIPDWILKTLKSCGKKVGIISTDDPHASRTLLEKKQWIDWWFTNEKTLEDEKNNIFYVPTATNSLYPTASRDEMSGDFVNDVVFVGTVYPDRVLPLEQACEYCERNGLKIGIYGPLMDTPKDSIIWKYAKNCIIGNEDTKKLYRGSRVVINIDRNVLWNSQSKEGNPNLLGDGNPYSANPRLYEIALCQTIQLYINPRQEAIDIFGDGIYISGYDDVYQMLDRIFSDDEELKKEKISRCFEIVKDQHLYLYRGAKIINILEKGEMNG